MLAFDAPQDSMKSVIGWIETWILKNQAKICQGFQEKGGWEGWAQMEIAEVLRSLPGGPTVQREHGIYFDSRKAVDFFVSWADGSRSPLCIELKCESLWKSSGQGRVNLEHTFYQDVSDDVVKLRYERKDDYALFPAYVVAITLSEEAAQGMRETLACEEETLDLGLYQLRVFLAPV